jgi:hypothetical protein
MTPAERQGTIDCMSDLSKDATGCRMRLDWASMTDDQLESWQGYFNRMIEADVEIENAKAPLVLAAWKDHIDQLVRLGAGDVRTAIKWDIEAMCAQDVDHYCYLHGLREKPEEIRSFR